MKPVRKGFITWPPVVIVKYWLHQSNTYMNWIELLHRWTLELLVFLPLLWWFCADNSMVMAALYAFLISHTFSAIVNGHLFAMLAHDLFWLSLYKDRESFYWYIEEMRARIQRKKPDYLSGGVFFGSLARGVFRETSDLDIRFIPEDGFINGLKCAHLVFVERFHALMAGYPIDAYMFLDEAEVRKKMDVSFENPVPVYLHGDKAIDILPEMQTFENFEQIFLNGPEENE